MNKGSDEMRILWISRHEMTVEQLDDLKRIYGEISITKVDKTISDAKEIEQFKGFDVIAVVLPINIIAELVSKNLDAQIIQPVAERIMSDEEVLNLATGEYEKAYIFKHKYWQKIISIEILL